MRWLGLFAISISLCACDESPLLGENDLAATVDAAIDAAIPGDAGSDGGTPTPNNCPSEIAALTKLYNNGPVDNWYDMVIETRILVTPDPKLPKRFGAVAW